MIGLPRRIGPVGLAVYAYWRVRLALRRLIGHRRRDPIAVAMPPAGVAGKPEVHDHTGWLCTAHCHRCDVTISITDDLAGVKAINDAGWRCTKTELFCPLCAPSSAKPLEAKVN